MCIQQMITRIVLTYPSPHMVGILWHNMVYDLLSWVLITILFTIVHSGTPGCINPIKKRFWSFSQYLLISYIPLAMTATSLLSASLNSVLSRSHMCLCWDYFNKPHVFQVCHCCLTWLWDGDTGHSLLSKSHSSCWERLTLVCFHTEKNENGLVTALTAFLTPISALRAV